MKYRNTKTGVIIDVPTAMSGNNWVKVEDGGAKPAVTLAPEVAEPTVKSGRPKSTQRKTAKG